MSRWDEFTGPNAAYLWELYERYCKDPQAVDIRTRVFFEQNPPPDLISNNGSGGTQHPAADVAATAPLPVPEGGLDSQALFYGAAARDLARSIRAYGHWAGQLD